MWHVIGKNNPVAQDSIRKLADKFVLWCHVEMSILPTGPNNAIFHTTSNVTAPDKTLETHQGLFKN